MQSLIIEKTILNWIPMRFLKDKNKVDLKNCDFNAKIQ